MENVKRLISFHHPSTAHAARTLDMDERTLASWASGTRDPSGRTLGKIYELYEINPLLLSAPHGSPQWAEFIRALGDPDRTARVDARIRERTEQ